MNKSTEEIVRHVKDVVTDTKMFNDEYLSFIILASDYLAVFDTVSREYISNVLR